MLRPGSGAPFLLAIALAALAFSPRGAGAEEAPAEEDPSEASAGAEAAEEGPSDGAAVEEALADPAGAGSDAPALAGGAPDLSEGEGGGSEAPSEGPVAPPPTEATDQPALPGALRGLADALAPAGVEERLAAVRELWERGDEAARAELVRLIEDDPDPEVRAAAIQALHGLRAENRRDLFLRVSYSDPDQRVRSLAQRLAGEARIPPRPGSTLLLLGWTFGGLAYVPTVVTGLIVLGIGAAEDDPDDLGMGWKLLVPVAGPIWGLVAHPLSGGATGNDIIAGFMVMSSLFQAAAVGLLVAGLVQWVRAGSPSDEEWRRSQELPAVLPLGPEGTVGLTVAGWL